MAAQTTALSFERPILDLEQKIEELKSLSSSGSVDVGDEIGRLEKKARKLRSEIFNDLTRWQVVQLSRHPQRPYTLDYVAALCTDFFELRGEGRAVMVLGHQKGRGTKENMIRNFGMSRPEGYRKAKRLMLLAERFKLPILTFIDTPGAYPGIGAEERGQTEAIAENLRTMAMLKVPIVCSVIGEGGSGGALAIGVGNRVLMMEYAIYSVISPESCSSILYRDPTKGERAAEALKLTAPDLLAWSVIDEVVREATGGAHRDPPPPRVVERDEPGRIGRRPAEKVQIDGRVRRRQGAPLMRPLVPPHIDKLSPYVPGKPIEETEREYGVRDVVKLASNENPLGPSPLAQKALARAGGKMHLYPDSSAFHLKRRLAAKHGVTPEEVFVASGSNEIIELLVRTFTEPGEEALICEGSFIMYKLTLQAHGRACVEAPMKDRAYLDAMADRVGKKTRIVFLANPDNPTGTYFGKAAFERLLARCSPETLVVMDEAYFEYVQAPDYPDSMTYRREHPNVISVRTFSKIFGLAGLRLGYAVLDRRYVDYLNRTRMPFNVSSLALEVGLAALDDVEHMKRSVAMNAEGLAYLKRELPKIGVEVSPSVANFVFVDLKRPSGPVYEALLRRGIIVRPIPNYGFPNAFRVSVGLPEDNARLVRALAEVLK
jgi:histidinol-phosphate aminotransferase